MAEKQHIGWIALNKEGVPHRPTKAGYSWQSGLTQPPRLYKSKGQAVRVANLIEGSVVEVFYEG